MATISFNPAQTLSPQDSFLLQTQGYVQGQMQDDQVAYQQIRQGFIASSVSGAVWAGMAVTQEIPAINSEQQGASLILAATVADLTGFTIGNKAYNSIIVPGSTVPTASAGQTTSFMKLGSGARIAVQCDPTLASSLAGGAVNQKVAWDFTNQQLIAYTSGTALPVTVEAISSNSKIVNVSGSSYTWTTGTCAIIQI